MKVIFPESLSVILAYNSLFLKKLEPRLNDWHPHQKIGDIFLEFVRQVMKFH
jgi:hypothetical protein